MKSKPKNISHLFRIILIIALIFTQIACVWILADFLHRKTMYIYILIEAISLTTIVHLIGNTKSPSFKMLWVIIILLLPITGHLMYDLWGKESLHRKKHDKMLEKIRKSHAFNTYDEQILRELERDHQNQASISKFLYNEMFPLYKNTECTYFSTSEETLQAMYEDMKKANKFILLNFFIIANGETWGKFHELLKEKVDNGVEIKIMYDDAGSMFKVSRDFKKRLESEGFEVIAFNPIHRYIHKLHLNFRNHQKIAVIDGKIGYTGGATLYDKYANINDGTPYFKESGIRLKGEGVWGLTSICLQMWEASKPNISINYEKYKQTYKVDSDTFCQPFSDGPANNPDHIAASVYKQIINKADKYIHITSPCLVLEDDMVDALCIASKRGVDVKIITPSFSHAKSLKRLNEFSYGRLLKSGVGIYEYTDGFMSAKTISNEHSCVVGTIEMSYRSFYVHYECGVWICDKEIVNNMNLDFENCIKSSRKIENSEWEKRPLFVRIQQHVLNVFSIIF